MALRRIQSVGTDHRSSNNGTAAAAGGRSSRRVAPSSSRRRSIQEGEANSCSEAVVVRPSTSRSGSSGRRRRETIHHPQSARPSRRTESSKHEKHESRPRSSRRATMDDRHEKSRDEQRSSSRSKPRVSSNYVMKERSPDKDKIQDLVKQITSIKRESSRGSSHTQSTGKLSSGSELSSGSRAVVPHPGSSAGEESPLPVLEMKVKRKSSVGAPPKIIEECSMLVLRPVTGRPKFIEPKTKDENAPKSKSKRPSAFQEIKDADPELSPVVSASASPTEKKRSTKEKTTPSRSSGAKEKALTSPSAILKSLSSNAKYPPPPLSRRHTTEGSKQQIQKSHPPPPPPRKSTPSHKTEIPLKSALREPRLSLNKIDPDLQTMQQGLSASTPDIHDMNNCLNLSTKSMDEDDSRRGSLSKSMLSLDDNEVAPPTSHSRKSSLNQSLLSLSETDAPFSYNRRRSLGQSILSLGMNQSDVGLDLNKSEPILTDQANTEPSKEKSHRKLSAFFRRSTTGNQPQPSSSPPPPSSEIKIPSTETNIPTTPNASTKRMLNADRPRHTHVVNMPYTDPTYGDSGLYTGEVDASKRPSGKGKMKYDNGIFYEGKWTNGVQEAKNIANRERMLSGFSSWKGQPKANGDQGCTVYGMDWVDLKGMAGKYTGSVDGDNVPSGRGVMKYDFGLIAEGEWIKGVLNDGGQMMGGAGTVVPGGGTVVNGGFPGGMSVVGGSGMSVVSGLGMMSISGGGGQGNNMMMNPMMNQYGCMGGAMMPQMQQQQMHMVPYGMPYMYDPSMMGQD